MGRRRTPRPMKECPMEPTVFTRILRRELPAAIVCEDGVGLVWPRKNPPIEELRRLAAKLVV
jgi:hypothetical protein